MVTQCACRVVLRWAVGRLKLYNNNGNVCFIIIDRQLHNMSNNVKPLNIIRLQTIKIVTVCHINNNNNNNDNNRSRTTYGAP